MTKEVCAMKLIKTLLAAVFTLAVIGSSPTWIHAATTKENAATTSETKKSASKKELLDINTSSADELKELPGIGDAYSKKIIDNRPYKRKDELVRKKVVPQATYDKIEDQIIAKQTKPPVI
jgi:competence protein ComEA